MGNFIGTTTINRFKIKLTRDLHYLGEKVAEAEPVSIELKIYI